ncbi:MAG: cofactor-independent phosphoglycerate mutase [Armatimonadota bacterium]
MKYVVVIPDGASDYPLDELDGKTPLQVARTPNLDALAKNGTVGAARTIPEGMPPGSDVGNLSVFGYDPRRYYTGRGPIEAASIGVPLNPRDVVYRCNLVSTDGERLLDYSAGHIDTQDARELIQYLHERLGARRVSFYPGVSYRHVMVWRDGDPDQRCVPPHDIVGQPIEPHLPRGAGDSFLISLIWNSVEILDAHEINRRRIDEGLPPANMIWPWGQGFVPSLPSFASRYGVTGAVVAAVDLVRGIGKLAGLRVIDVPGATGYLDTNYEGKGRAAVQALEELDLVVVHVEAPDEAGHKGDVEAKIYAIEQIDSCVVRIIREGLQRLQEPCRILVMPDHPTPIPLRTHCAEPVPFLLWDSEVPSPSTHLPFDERVLGEGVSAVEGYRAMDMLIHGR